MFLLEGRLAVPVAGLKSCDIKPESRNKAASYTLCQYNLGKGGGKKENKIFIIQEII
jgi:hypothetical protein